MSELLLLFGQQQETTVREDTPIPTDRLLLSIERAIVQRLSESISDKAVRIRALPEALERERSAPKAEILVGYQRSRFADFPATPARQNMIAQFEVGFLMKNLRTHESSYPLIDLSRASLIDFYPIGGLHKGLRITDEQLRNLSGKDANTTWFYSQRWELSLIIPNNYTELPENPVQLPDDVVIKCGLWRSLAGHVGDKEKSNFDRVISVS